MLATNIKDVGGEGFYDVVECKFDLVKEYIEEYGEDLNYERFLNLVGIVTCKVTPTSPKYNNYIKGTVPFFYVGYVDTNQVQPKPKRQWPTEYPDGMPSWYKNSNN